MLSKVLRLIELLLIRPLVVLAYGKKYAGNSIYIFKTYLIWQKIFRINGEVPWPVHPSSRVTNWQKIRLKEPYHPGSSPGCYIQAGNGIELGSGIRIGPNVGIVSANHDPINYDRWVKDEPIRIGDNVWIGMNTSIMPAVQIGSNVVIGAGSVVTKNIPSNTVAVGNPCRVIRKITKQNGQ